MAGFTVGQAAVQFSVVKIAAANFPLRTQV